MAGPYAGIRVLELGRFIAAPYCGQLLADGGADVIKVEPIAGDDARRNGTRLSATEARQFLNKNRGKRSIAVKLSDPAICRIVADLAAASDVVIANFRPGHSETLGLDHATLAKRNPRLVYAENTAFGKRGPLADNVGMDAVLQARTGIAPVVGEAPMLLTDPIIDYTAAVLMAWGIATALFHRERAGHGQRLDVSLLQAALVIQNNSVNHIDAVDGWRDEFVAYAKDAFARGATLADVLAHRASLKPAISPAYYGFFRTADGLLALAAGGRGLQRRAAAVLGIDDPALAVGWVADDMPAHVARMREATSAALLTQPTAHWLAAFEAADVPVGPVLLKDQVLDDAQSWANDYLVRLEHEVVGGMTVVAPPVRFEETPLAADRASPVLGRHTREVLREAGVPLADIDALVASGVAYSTEAKAVP